ncbi:hypothetical protein ULMS_08750 [Patiriisocius marinistellae]|uniref:NlpC/P60 domain-containing protein n=1 Tax=Patiriisocius marinistellae TaxID=2494560 RepID=A0A5J4FSU6_9FLAO|nr:C40 family peptidase [Patiriisocius marinistellae]GEQ85367.1 hypothetical protein ULMS_08750 [Patiriisocius marinistellae]
MPKKLYILLLSILLASCGSSKGSTSRPSKIKTERNVSISKSSNRGASRSIVDFAKTFEGTRYKYGGTTNRGMDCSGLVYTAFANENIQLPRVSRDMAKRGKRVSIDKANEGDLVFFKTSKSSKNINHVGLIVDTGKNGIMFIHSTTSRGVIISSLEEGYWKNAFVEARTIL